MNESLNMRLQTMKSNGRSGKIRENLSGQLAFSSFVPADLQDIQIQYTDEMVRLLGKAYLLLGRYEKKPVQTGRIYA